MAFHEEEKSRNKKIQASISQTIRRQSEALVKRRSTAKATVAAYVRRSRRCGTSRNQSNDMQGSDDDADGNGNEGGRESSSADEHCTNSKMKRHKRWTGRRFSQLYFFSVPPAYYAHLGAFRTRYYIEGEALEGIDSTGSHGGGGTNIRATTVIVHPLPKINC